MAPFLFVSCEVQSSNSPTLYTLWHYRRVANCNVQSCTPSPRCTGRSNTSDRSHRNLSLFHPHFGPHRRNAPGGICRCSPRECSHNNPRRNEHRPRCIAAHCSYCRRSGRPNSSHRSIRRPGNSAPSRTYSTHHRRCRCNYYRAHRRARWPRDKYWRSNHHNHHRSGYERG